MHIREVVSKNYSPRGNIKVWNTRGYAPSVFWIFIKLLRVDNFTNDRSPNVHYSCFIKWFQKSERSLVKTNACSRHSSITHGSIWPYKKNKCLLESDLYAMHHFLVSNIIPFFLSIFPRACRVLAKGIMHYKSGNSKNNRQFSLFMGGVSVWGSIRDMCMFRARW